MVSSREPSKIGAAPSSLSSSTGVGLSLPTTGHSVVEQVSGGFPAEIVDHKAAQRSDISTLDSVPDAYTTVVGLKHLPVKRSSVHASASGYLPLLADSNPKSLAISPALELRFYVLVVEPPVREVNRMGGRCCSTSCCER